MIRFLALAALLATASPALAQFDRNVGRSPKWGSVDVGVQWFRPNVDGDFPQKPGPYEMTFGSEKGWMLVLGVSKSLYTAMGSLDVGVKTGYFSDSAKGFVLDNPLLPANPTPQQVYSLRAGGDTQLKIVPTSAVLTYRFDWAAENQGIPLAPYVRVAFERYNWWVSSGSGKTVESGATNGWSAAAGLAFLLDIIDRQLAREFDLESGVNHTYLFAEIVTARIDDFGSKTSWDLSPEGLSLAGGMTFVF